MKKPTRSVVRRTAWPDSVSRPVATPLQHSVVYSSDSPDGLDDQYEGRTKGYTYAREAHPNADVLAEKIDVLEGCSGGIITSSGMAAISATVFGLLKTGDHVIGADQLYGRTLRLFKHDLPRMGIETSLADPTDAAKIAKGIQPNTRMILIELISNPTLRVADIQGIAKLARQHDILLVVDNTFTTPRAFQPMEHGADIVIHSVTKLLAGHSDATLGYVVAKNPELQTQINETVTTFGFTPSPYDCWLAERGLYSFELRYDRAQENAAMLAGVLVELPGVTRVLYPTRSDHPEKSRADALLNGQGGNMVSFEIKGGRQAANQLVRSLPNIAFAPTLGDIGTTLSHPASSSHRALTVDERTALGISEGFFRVSLGVEDADLLINEFATALKALN